MVGVYCTEGSKTIAHDGEEGDEDIVDYVDHVELSGADVDPACRC